MLRRSPRTLLTLLALLALAAIPLAAGAGLCCAAPQAACCSQHCSEPGLCVPMLAPQTEEVQGPAPLADQVMPLLARVLPREEDTPEQVHHEAAPRPRTPLLEGGACLNTTFLPPPANA